MGNLYDILGLAPDASDIEIKRAFRRLSLELHPDRSSSSHSSKYTEVIKAYETLSNRDTRQQYDMANGHLDRQSNGKGWTNRVRVEEKVETGRSVRHGHSFDGCEVRENERVGSHIESASNVHDISHHLLADIYEEVTVSLEDCYSGTAVPVNIVRRANGREEKTTVYVEIPKGTDDGEMIMKEGLGNRRGMHRSNLLVKVIVEPHRYFKRQGLNLIYSMSLTLKEAICGFSRELEHLDGRTYKIMSESDVIVQPYAKRVIMGKGFSRDEFGAVGNLVIMFDIKLPDRLTQEAKETLDRILP